MDFGFLHSESFPLRVVMIVANAMDFQKENARDLDGNTACVNRVWEIESSIRY